MGRFADRKVALPGVRLGGSEEADTVLLIDGPAERTMPGLDAAT